MYGLLTSILYCPIDVIDYLRRPRSLLHNNKVLPVVASSSDLPSPDWFEQACEPLPRGALVNEAAQFLRAYGIEAPMREARLILGIVLDKDQAEIFGHPETLVSTLAMALFRDALKRRVQGEPLSRLRGEREFWSMPFKISHATLDPRADSESLIEALLHHCSDRRQPLRMLDLGVGTGCLLLAALSEFPNATGVGVDLSPETLAIAQHNADLLNLSERATWQRSNWGDEVSGQFDVILSNPPYIASAQVVHLEATVKNYDPHLALDGGEDGLSCFRSIAPVVARHLLKDGLAFIEHGDGQASAVKAIFATQGLKVLANFADGGLRPRGLIFYHEKSL